MSGIATLALYSAPIVTSNAVFSMRRASRGLDAIDEKPIYGMMNLDIAAGQTLKGTQAATALATCSNPNLAQATHSAAEAFKKAADANKFINGVGKVVKFTANNINPIICVTSGVKVLSSEDKTDAAAREVIALPAMFMAEGITKKAIGMPTFKNGKAQKREATNLFLKQQLQALDDYCNTKKLFNNISLKYVPGITKGLMFVAASIAGYTLGIKAGNIILGEPSVNNEGKKINE